MPRLEREPFINGDEYIEGAKKGIVAASNIAPEGTLDFLIGIDGRAHMPWKDFFGCIRKHSLKQQLEIIAELVGVKGLDLPHSEELANFFTEINNNEWFLPLEEPDPSFLQEQVDQTFEAFNLPSQQATTIRDWKGARDKSCTVEKSVMNDYDRNFYDAKKRKASNSWGWKIKDAGLDVYCMSSDILGDWVNQEIYYNFLMGPIETDRLRRGYDTRETEFKIYDVPWGPIHDGGLGGPVDDIRRAIKSAGLWIMFKDKMVDEGYMGKNPFMPLVELYKKGLWPIGSLNGEFLMLIPPNPDPEWKDDVYHSPDGPPCPF